MDGNEELFEMLDDLEAQAEALQHQERVAEVADRARAEYGAVTLDSRLMASAGRAVEVEVLATGRLRGEVGRVGPGWFQLDAETGTWWLRTACVTALLGASERAVPEVAWSPVDRLGLGSVLRRLADEQEGVVLHLVDGSRQEGRVTRVGADFAEVLPAGDRRRGSTLVPLAHVAAFRTGRTG